MQEILKKYRSHMIKEGILKSLLFGGIGAFAALAISAIVFWMADFRLVWLVAVIFAGVLLISTPIIYFAAFRPTEKSVARRVDKELGLDERVLTMMEFSGRNDIMACAQRANAVSVLRGAKYKKLTLAVCSVAVISALAITFVVGAGMTTVSALSANGIIPSGKELLSGGPKVPETYTITYKIEGTGTINGDVDPVITQSDIDGFVKSDDYKYVSETTKALLIDSNKTLEEKIEEIEKSETIKEELMYLPSAYVQTVTEGQSAKSIIAVPGTDSKNEWYFAGWSDGSVDPYRLDKFVTEDITLTATFMSVENDGSGLEEDMADELPGTVSDSEENNGDGPSDEPVKPVDPGEKEPSDGAGGQTNPSNSVIDGQTYYGDVYGDASEQAKSEMNGNDNIPDDLKDIAGDYMDIINSNPSEGENP